MALRSSPDPALGAGVPRHGALVRDGDTRFLVWAPHAVSLVVLLEAGGRYPMEKDGEGYFEVFIDGVQHGDRYHVELDGESVFPDPASRFQPEGVHGPSMVIDPHLYAWADSRRTLVEQTDLVFYELHVGSFTPDGTFDGVRSRLPYLRDLGVTAVELMPVADFPGRWNWGYDHAALFAPSRAYGRPDDLRRLVDDAHGLGLAVYLDVIYNHLGPDGAYVAAFAPMFTERHATPWGQAINLDDDRARGVRSYFIDNARMWLDEFHIDGLRLDATHALIDDSDVHFLEELKIAVESINEGPERLLIAEDHRNENRLVRSRADGGFQLDAVWTDDFHHQIRNLTAGDRDGYYVDYAHTDAHDLATTINQGWFYDGRDSTYAGTPRGTDASLVRPDQCVFCIQNHDQVGNRPTGRRLSHDVSPAVYRTATALLLFAPEIPLLFMGQEWAATTPFQFFTDHVEPLGSQVSSGRREEFRSFEGFKGEVPDPQDPDTFFGSRLQWSELDLERHAGILNLYRDLLRLRPELDPETMAVAVGPSSLRIRRGSAEMLASFDAGTTFDCSPTSKMILHTEEQQYVVGGLAPIVHDREVILRAPSAIIVST